MSSTTSQSTEGKTPSSSTSDSIGIEASFSNLSISIGTQAIVALGLAENPITKKIENDRNLARFNIDLLRMLKEKTKGNLTSAEEGLINNLVHDLQLKFVETNK